MGTLITFPGTKPRVLSCHQIITFLLHLELSLGTQIKPAQFLNQEAKGSVMAAFCSSQKCFFRERGSAAG